MSSFLMRNLNGITSASIEKYLLLTGWKIDNTLRNKRIVAFRNKADPDFQIAIPADEGAKDFYARVYDLVQVLSSYSNIPEQNIIDSLKSAYTDRIQFRIVAQTSEGGKIPLDYAARCLEGLKDLVLYAACAEESARPVCARTYNNAKNNLEKFQFEQTEIGSFIFNVGVQVASEENEQYYLDDAAPPLPEPTPHKIIKRIETAMQQVNSVAERQERIGDLVEYAYEDGLTANMCDAIVKLKPDRGEEVVLQTSIFYAEALTRAVSPPKVAILDNVHFALLDEISKRYKDCTLVEDVVLTGTIKMLSRGLDNDAENTIRLLTKIDNRMRAVDLHLSPESHLLACNAYRDDKEVSVTGVLDKSSKRWFFSEVTDFKVL